MVLTSALSVTSGLDSYFLVSPWSWFVVDRCSSGSRGRVFVRTTTDFPDMDGCLEYESPLDSFR